MDSFIYSFIRFFIHVLSRSFTHSFKQPSSYYFQYLSHSIEKSRNKKINKQTIKIMEWDCMRGVRLYVWWVCRIKIEQKLFIVIETNKSSSLHDKKNKKQKKILKNQKWLIYFIVFCSFSIAIRN